MGTAEETQFATGGYSRRENGTWPIWYGSRWDSTMTAYPYLLPKGERVLLFYCGNGFGSAGFGWAELA